MDPAFLSKFIYGAFICSFLCSATKRMTGSCIFSALAIFCLYITVNQDLHNYVLQGCDLTQIDNCVYSFFFMSFCLLIPALYPIGRLIDELFYKCKHLISMISRLIAKCNYNEYNKGHKEGYKEGYKKGSEEASEEAYKHRKHEVALLPDEGETIEKQSPITTHAGLTHKDLIDASNYYAAYYKSLKLSGEPCPLPDHL